MASGKKTRKKKHRNDEETVRCPVDGCGKEILSRGLHLHVNRSSGDGHGPQGEVPKDVDLDEAEKVGTQKVEMEYPEEREQEAVARLCPYCERPFKGKYGVMIHLGHLAGRKNHPEDGREIHDLEDFAIVHVDENQNVVEIVEEETAMPSTKQRKEKSNEDAPREEDIRQHIQDLRDQGLDDEADRAEQMLLGE